MNMIDSQNKKKSYYNDFFSTMKKQNHNYENSINRQKRKHNYSHSIITVQWASLYPNKQIKNNQNEMYIVVVNFRTSYVMSGITL